MDFEDGGIETDPTLNASSSTDPEKTLKQPVAPIISFSPERCRFDSAQSSSRRKSSSTSFPISVEDLQLDQPLSSASTCITNNGLPAKSIPSSVLPSHPSHLPPQPQPIILDDTCSTSTSSPFIQPQLFTSQPLQSTPAQSAAAAAFSFLHSAPLTTTATGGTLQSGALVTSAASLLIRPAIVVSSSASLSAALLPEKRSTDNSHPISLMVNGTVLSATPSSTPAPIPSSSSTSSSSTTALELQKRLEKRIAQASAIAAAAAASTSNSSNSTCVAAPATTSSSSCLSPASPPETTPDSILLTDIIGIANKPVTAVATSSSSKSSIGKGDGNQISFSPEKASSSSAPSQFTAAVASLEQLEPSASSSQQQPSLWEAESSTIDFWESGEIGAKAAPSSNTGGESGESTADCFAPAVSTATTSCPASSDSANNNANGRNSSTSSSRSKSSKGNQSLRNNNGTGNRKGSPPPPSAVQPPTSHVPVAAASVAPSFSDKTPSVITVVNASFDIRKVSALLPPQRLAIPSKSGGSIQCSQKSRSSTVQGKASTTASKNSNNNGSLSNNSATFSSTANASDSNSNPPPTCSASISSSVTTQPTSGQASVHKAGNTGTSNSGTARLSSISETQISSGNGNIKTGLGSNSLASKLSNDLEKKPLVQWDSDESEEELSFFPPAKRGIITDNLSIDNMSLSGEEEDLHLTPPRPLAKKCPCDPRTWLEKAEISAGHHHHPHHHHHGEGTRVISSKFSCVIF